MISGGPLRDSWYVASGGLMDEPCGDTEMTPCGDLGHVLSHVEQWDTVYLMSASSRQHPISKK